MNFKDTTPKQWLSCPTETEAKVAGLTDADHWVLFNIQAAGKKPNETKKPAKTTTNFLRAI